MEQTLRICMILFGITSSFYVAAAITVFLHCFHDAGILWTKKKAIMLGVTALLEGVANIFWYDSLIASCFFLIAYLIIPIHDYAGNKFRAMLRVARVYFLSLMPIGMATFVSMYFVFPNYDLESDETSTTEYLILSILTTLFFAFVFHYLHQRIYKAQIFIPCGMREKLFVTLYTIASFVLYSVVLISGKDGMATLTIMAGFIVLLMALLPLFVYHTRISEYYRERTHYQETYLQAELAHFQQYKQAQEETRRFRHDIRNNLLCMRELLHAGKVEEAADYLQGLLETADTLSAKYVSGDEILDCILSAKGEVMTQKGITFQLDGVLAGGLPWKPIDVCSVFANALDNAMEACEGLPPAERRITMKLKATPQFWFIRIENPVARDVEVSRLFLPKGGYTSKADAGQHGIGTYNMKRTVESYGGILKADCRERQFVLEMMLDKTTSASA